MASMSTKEPLSAARTLSAAGRSHVQRGWAERLSVPVEALASPGTRFIARADASALVVVELSDACVVVGPPPVTAQLQGLDKGELLDVTLMVARLEFFQPRPIGTASLSYRDARLTSRVSVTTGPADPTMVEELQEEVSADEWHESGLSDMPQHWAALTPDGRIAALAGFERWGADIAQMGVAANRTERGRGYAAAAAGEAMTAAMNDGLIAQWRCQVGNTASQRLAARLGFTPLGRQAAVALG